MVNLGKGKKSASRVGVVNLFRYPASREHVYGVKKKINKTGTKKICS